MLDQRGFSGVRIVAADKKWRIAEDVLKDAELASILLGNIFHQRRWVGDAAST